jgi:non-ribosomal peptide synthase protein (TIGR01720 family)
VRLPVEGELAGNVAGSMKVVGLSLGEEETKGLEEVGRAYHGELWEVVLTGLVQGLKEWGGESRVVIGMEGHGRDEVVSGVDVSRTVGWFTSLYPLVVEVGDGVGEGVKRVKEEVRGVPKKGVGYGMLRYLSEKGELREELSGVEAEVSFNYLGRVDRMMDASEKLFRRSREALTEMESPRNRRPHLIDVMAQVRDGRLQLSLLYSDCLYSEDRMNGLMQALRHAYDDLVEHSRQPTAGDYTPSDFPLADLNQANLQKVLELLAEPGE